MLLFCRSNLKVSEIQFNFKQRLSQNISKCMTTLQVKCKFTVILKFFSLNILMGRPNHPYTVGGAYRSVPRCEEVPWIFMKKSSL